MGTCKVWRELLEIWWVPLETLPSRQWRNTLNLRKFFTQLLLHLPWSLSSRLKLDIYTKRILTPQSELQFLGFFEINSTMFLTRLKKKKKKKPYISQFPTRWYLQLLWFEIDEGFSSVGPNTIVESTHSRRRGGCFKWNTPLKRSRFDFCFKFWFFLGLIAIWVLVGFCWLDPFLLIQLGSTAIGLKTKEGVVLAVEKRVTSPLLVLVCPSD